MSTREAKSDRRTLFQAADSHLSEQTDVCLAEASHFPLFFRLCQISPKSPFIHQLCPTALGLSCDPAGLLKPEQHGINIFMESHYISETVLCGTKSKKIHRYGTKSKICIVIQDLTRMEPRISATRCLSPLSV